MEDTDRKRLLARTTHKLRTVITRLGYTSNGVARAVECAVVPFIMDEIDAVTGKYKAGDEQLQYAVSAALDEERAAAALELQKAVANATLRTRFLCTSERHIADMRTEVANATSVLGNAPEMVRPSMQVLIAHLEDKILLFCEELERIMQDNDYDSMTRYLGH